MHLPEEQPTTMGLGVNYGFEIHGNLYTDPYCNWNPTIGARTRMTLRKLPIRKVRCALTLEGLQEKTVGKYAGFYLLRLLRFQE